MNRALCAAALVLALAGAASAAPEADRITSLPGFNGTLPSAHYSGYLDFDDGTHYHYWLQMSESDAANDPVVMWTNGGPGCSGMDGQFYEQGALHFADAEQSSGLPNLVLNPYRWNQKATMVYLELPAGVGFSYIDGQSTYSASDTSTAKAVVQALIQLFYTKFPELQKNDFYITGESYAGTYVPNAAHAIQAHNSNGTDQPINLVGFSTGNGCVDTDPSVKNPGPCSGAFNWDVDFLHGHGLYSDALYKKIQAACTDVHNPSYACEELLAQMGREVGPVNVYNVYSKCIDGNGERKEIVRRRPKTRFDSIMEEVGGPIGCIDGIAVGTYLNHPSVRQALHVASEDVTGRWTVCSSNLDYTSDIKSVRPFYPELIKDYRVMIYSGDADACVPYVATEWWTSSMGFPVTNPWHAWYTDSPWGKQVAGYATSYGVNNFQFVTVHGSGHMVPQQSDAMGRPEAALTMFEAFLAGKQL